MRYLLCALLLSCTASDFVPELDLSGCMQGCRTGLALCNDAEASCIEEYPEQEAECKEEMSCVELTLDCVVACIERAEEELK